MEKDLKKIEKLGKIREKENLRFRVFLKGWDRPQEELDKRVHDLYEKFKAEIECSTCTNCCKTIEPVLDEDDIKRLANAMDLSVEEFEHRFLKVDESWGEKIFKEKPCPLLRGNSCQYYEDRPKVCKSYPFLHKPLFTTRLLGVIENYSICPIVFNVYESLKKELWH